MVVEPQVRLSVLLTLSVRYGAAQGRSPRGSAQPAAGRGWGPQGWSLRCPPSVHRATGGTIFGRFFDVSQRQRQPQELVQAKRERRQSGAGCLLSGCNFVR